MIYIIYKQGVILLECGWEVAEQFVHRVFARYSDEEMRKILTSPSEEEAQITSQEANWKLFSQDPFLLNDNSESDQ
jgi:hypothetical protein